MVEYINRDINISDYIEVWDCKCIEGVITKVVAVDDLKYLPTEDVAPIKHGRWIFDAECYQWNCSECHNWSIDGSSDDEKTYYCPNCGAKMDLGE